MSQPLAIINYGNPFLKVKENVADRVESLDQDVCNGFIGNLSPYGIHSLLQNKNH